MGRPARRTAPLDLALDFSLTAWRPVVLGFLLLVTLLLLFLHILLLPLLQFLRLLIVLLLHLLLLLLLALLKLLLPRLIRPLSLQLLLLLVVLFVHLLSLSILLLAHFFLCLVLLVLQRRIDRSGSRRRGGRCPACAAGPRIHRGILRTVCFLHVLGGPVRVASPAGRHGVTPIKSAGPRSGRNVRPAVIHRCPQFPAGAGGLLMLHLHGRHLDMMLASRSHVLRGWPSRCSAWTTVKADASIRCVFADNCCVVGVVKDHD